MGVDHLGSTRSGGSAFTLTIEIRLWSSWLEFSWLAFTFTMFLDYYDGWLDFMIDVLSLWMYGCIMYGE